ncbi:MAG: HNH endonuclease signature motif containing protein, partial [Nitriliruptor sp.]
PPRIVRWALDRLACDAALDVVVRDGVDLVAARRYAPGITAATRRAIAARDGGCRFPGCTAPISWCDVHHVRPRAAEHHPDAVDGDHHPTNLVALCRRHHTLVHGRGWRQQFEPDGTYRLRRRGRTWTTLPRRDQQLPPPRHDLADAVPRAGPNATSRTGPASTTRAGSNGSRPAVGADPSRTPTGSSPTNVRHPVGPSLPF